MTRVLVIVTAVMAVAQVVIGVLAVADDRAAIAAMAVALLGGAAIFGTISILFAVALRRMR
jgi:hypothetical protein